MSRLSPLDMLLMHYATGNLSPQEQLLVAAHVLLNDDARRRVTQYEALGGKLMCEGEPAAVKSGCLSTVMNRIDKTPCAENQPTATNPIVAVEKPATTSQPAQMTSVKQTISRAPDLNIPDAIYALISSFCGANASCWSQVTRGYLKMDISPTTFTCTRTAKMIPVPGAGGKRLRLIKLEPRQAAPRHSHDGVEITLLLYGTYADETGRYKKGDIVILADPRLAHQPVAGEEGCISLTLTEAPLRFTDPFQRFLNAFRGF